MKAIATLSVHQGEVDDGTTLKIVSGIKDHYELDENIKIGVRQ